MNLLGRFGGIPLGSFHGSLFHPKLQVATLQLMRHHLFRAIEDGHEDLKSIPALLRVVLPEDAVARCPQAAPRKQRPTSYV